MALETISSVTGAYHDGARTVTRTGAGDAGAAITSIEPQTMNADTRARTENQVAGTEENDRQAEKKLWTAVSEANSKLKGKRTGCEFTYHEETKRVSIKVYDKDTKEIIREIPPEESIKMIEKIWELAGLLVDEKR